MNETPLVIRPMTLGEILDKAIRLYRQNFIKFVGIIAIPYIPLVLIQIVLTLVSTTQVLQSVNNDPSAFPFSPLAISAFAGSFIVSLIQIVLVSGFATAALTRAVANNYMNKPVSILDSYRAITGSAWKLILALFLSGILVFALLIWTIIPIVGWFSGPGILMFLSFIVIPLIAPIASLERFGVTQTIRRAWDLGRGRFWWLLGYSFVLMLLGQIIVSGPVLLLNAILQAILLSLSDLSFEVQMAINSILPNLLTLTLNLLYLPLQLTMMTVVYFDLRARTEGLDLALQLSSIDESQSASTVLPEISSPQTNAPILTSIDIGRFALLSLIAAALFGCYFIFIFAFAGALAAGF